ncbi:MAG: DUF4332 domain-containing protein [Bacteroidales bacterium]|nr:DUF4332 domain-containing protein [Bacteroidales bacterium]
MCYYIDLSKISISAFKEKIKEADLLPSQKILREKLDERFSIIEKNGITNMLELQTVLKTKEKVKAFAQKSTIVEDFLNILRREVNSYHPNPNNIRDFPGINIDVAAKLERAGIKHTLHLFERIRTKSNRTELATELNIDNKILYDLAKLTDLSRIKWVGPIFARLLFESGFDTAEKVSMADYRQLYKTVIEINNDKKYYRGKFGENDMKLCVKVAVDVPKIIEF